MTVEEAIETCNNPQVQLVIEAAFRYYDTFKRQDSPDGERRNLRGIAESHQDMMQSVRMAIGDDCRVEGKES